MISKNIIAITIICIFSLNPVFSQYNWEEVILPDSIISYKIDFDTTGKHFIATNHGMYTSEDGYQWEQSSLNEGVGNIYINENNTIYIGGYRLYRSFDNGISWDTLFHDPGITVGPIYTIGDSSIFFGTWGGIYRSIDSGQTWENVLEVYSSEACNAIVSNSEGTLFAGTTAYVGGGSPGGVYKSEDNGLTWQLSNLDYHFVSDIVINSNDEIFVGTNGHYQTGGGRVFKSSDNGDTWGVVYEHNLISTMDINIYDEVALGCITQGYPGGIFCTYDDGVNWNEITGNLPTHSFSFVAFNTNSYLYAITRYDYSLFRTRTVVDETETLMKGMINVFPNPTKNEINIVNSNEYDNVIIADISGTTIINLSLDTFSDLIIVDVSQLKSGLYFIYLSDKYQNNTVSKFIKY